jgi:beta-galactosidase
LDKLNFPYEDPQEAGNRTGVRWVSISDSKGDTLTIKGLPEINFSAWPYTMENASSVKHNYELVKTDFVTVNIDYGQQGLGGDTTWGSKAKPHSQFLFKPGKIYKYSFSLKGKVGQK